MMMSVDALAQLTSKIRDAAHGPLPFSMERSQLSWRHSLLLHKIGIELLEATLQVCQCLPDDHGACALVRPTLLAPAHEEICK